MARKTNHIESMRELLGTIESLQTLLGRKAKVLAEHKEKSLNEKWANLNERAANRAFFVAECKDLKRGSKSSIQDIEKAFKQKNDTLDFNLEANNAIIDMEMQQMFSLYVEFGSLLHKWTLQHAELKNFQLP